SGDLIALLLTPVVDLSRHLCRGESEILNLDLNYGSVGHSSAKQKQGRTECAARVRQWTSPGTSYFNPAATCGPKWKEKNHLTQLVKRKTQICALGHMYRQPNELNCSEGITSGQNRSVPGLRGRRL